MKTLTIVGLCAGLAAAPLVARAAELVLFDGSGQPVAVLTPVTEPALTPGPMSLEPMPLGQIGFPIAGLFAQQDAMIRSMMRDMQALQAATIPAAGGSGLGRGTTIMVSSFSDGHSSCSRTVTYQAQPGGAPVMEVSQTGDACSALPTPSPQATTPVAEPAAPKPASPTGPHLYQIDYRHKVTAPSLHHG